jgi:subtilisin family serine protease
LLSYDPALGDPEAIAAKLRARPFVRAAGANYVYHATQTTNDPSFHLSDSLYNTGGNSGRAGEILDADIDIEQAWATTKGSGSIIAVVDSGVDIDHADLAANIWNNSADPVDGIDNDGDGFIDDTHGWNFVAFDYPVGMGPCGVTYTSRPALDPNLTESNDPRPKPNGVDEDGCNGADSGAIHGTHVAGIAAARVNNAEGTAGVAPEATILPLRALDDEGLGDTSQIVDAIDFAVTHNADVVNMSFSTAIGSYDSVFDISVENARSHEVVLVAAAGNSDADLAHTSEDPDSHIIFEDSLASPVTNDCGTDCSTGTNKIIGVASVANNDDKASYSNYSSKKKYIDTSAPGGDWASSQTAIYSTAYQDNAYDCCKSPVVVGGYAYEEGTSMAAPVVSGVVALIRSAYPSMSASDVTDRIRNFTDSIGVANLGQGRVNAAHAILGSRVTRSSGATRYDTAIQTSEFTFPVDGTASAVVLASGENFPDGLGASALARVKNGPLLLTPKTALTAATLTEINRVLSDKTKTIYVVGGTAVIDSAIDSALTTDGFTSVQRVSGADRVATAQQVANLVSPGTVGSVVMVGKSNFPDALSAAAVVAKRSVPLFLNSANALDVSNLSWFQTHSVTRVYVVGGMAVVSDAV